MEFYQEYLSRFSKSGVAVKDLSRFERLCEALCNPQDGLRFIHVAGTNGKGSISEFISAALIAEGFKVGKFTSPYILKINERIMLNNVEINNFDFSRLMKQIAESAEKLGESGYSQFELLTATAFLYFKEKNVDFAVIETGIGGSLDCTNIIKPVISAIGKIDFDHTSLLGDTLAEIARHKAGIIKQAISCVVYPQQEDNVLSVFYKKAQTADSLLTVPNIETLIIKETSVFGNRFNYEGVDYNTTMGGEFQVFNAITAIETLKALNIGEMSIKQGLNTAVLMARMQVLGTRPTVVFDGAHNPSGIKAAANTVAHIPCKKVILFGMLASKDFPSSIKQLCSVADEIVFVDDFDGQAVEFEEFLLYTSQLRFDKGKIYKKSHHDALSFARERAEDGLVLVCGSLYLCGKLISFWKNPAQ